MSIKDGQSPTCIGVRVRLRIGSWVRLGRRFRAWVSLGVCMDVVCEDGQNEEGLQGMDGWTEFRIILHWGPLSKYYDAHQKSQLKFDQKPLTPKSASPRRYPICRETHEDSKKYKYIVSRPPKPSLFFVAMSANASARVSYVLLPERVEGGGKPVCLSD